jgi:hypothetical protein
MRLAAVLLTMVLVICPAALADVPENLKDAADAADGVIIGLIMGCGTGGFPYMDFCVLDVLKGPSPGEKLGVAFPPETISGINVFKPGAKHGSILIIPYSRPLDKFGRYTYAGPRFDSQEIIATPENAAIVKPGSKLFEIPSSEQAVKEADVVAIGTINSYDDDKEANKAYYHVTDILKGRLSKRDIAVVLGSRYLYWIFSSRDYQANLEPVKAKDPRILLLKRQGQQLYYAGPVFTSARFPATPENIAEVCRLLEISDSGWTWWIVGVVAALVALIAAVLVSKVDYKYDRRRERLEKLRSSDDSDSGAGQPGK